MTPFETIIKEHLEKKAGSDAVFAEKFIERCKADHKAIEGCCAYITAEAKKKAQNGCAVIADAEVFGLASHYIQEDIKAPEKKVTPAKVAYVAPTPKAEPAKPKKAEVEWPSLFNFDE